MELSKPRVVVGLDFGTTFSRFAFTVIPDPDNVYPFLDYPFLEVSYCKTVTGIYYKNVGPGKWQFKSWGDSARGEYASDVREMQKQCLRGASGPSNDPLQPSVGAYFTGFKLHLASKEMGASSAQELPRGLTVSVLITDYLREMGALILKRLQGRRGAQLTKQDIQWCVTVPSIWDNAAKAVMKTCMAAAGLVNGVDGSPHPLIMVLELEAASFYCVNSMRRILKVGDKLLVANIGAGTSDIVVQEVVSDERNTYGVKEVTTSSGDSCGGTHVDQRFMEFLHQKIGPCLQECIIEDPNICPLLSQTWEHTKISFGLFFLEFMRDSIDFELPSRVVRKWNEVKRGMGISERDSDSELEISYEETQAFFDPVIEENMQLISHQLAQAGGVVKALYVVGGFAGSPYVMSCIKRRFSRVVPQIIRPPNRGSAVCKGAVMLALSPDTVLSRAMKLELPAGAAFIPPNSGPSPSVPRAIKSETVPKDSKSLEWIHVAKDGGIEVPAAEAACKVDVKDESPITSVAAASTVDSKQQEFLVDSKQQESLVDSKQQESLMESSSSNQPECLINGLKSIAKSGNKSADFNSQSLSPEDETIIFCDYDEKDKVCVGYVNNYKVMAGIAGVGFEYGKLIFGAGFKIRAVEISKDDWEIGQKTIWSHWTKLKLKQPEALPMRNRQDLSFLSGGGRPVLWDIATHLASKRITSVSPSQGVVGSGNRSNDGSSSSQGHSGGGLRSVGGDGGKSRSRANGGGNEGYNDDKRDPRKGKEPANEFGDAPNGDLNKKMKATVYVDLLQSGGELVLDAKELDDAERNEYGLEDAVIKPTLEFEFSIDIRGTKAIQASVEGAFRLDVDKSCATEYDINWFHDQFSMSFGADHKHTKLVSNSKKLHDVTTKEIQAKEQYTSQKQKGSAVEAKGGVHGVVVLSGVPRGKKMKSSRTGSLHEGNICWDSHVTQGGFTVDRTQFPGKVAYICKRPRNPRLNIKKLKDAKYREELMDSPMCKVQIVKFQAIWEPRDTKGGGKMIKSPTCAPYVFEASRDLQKIVYDKTGMEENFSSAGIRKLRTRPEASNNAGNPMEFRAIQVKQNYARTLYLNHAMSHLNGGHLKFEEVPDERRGEVTRLRELIGNSFETPRKESLVSCTQANLGRCQQTTRNRNWKNVVPGS